MVGGARLLPSRDTFAEEKLTALLLLRLSGKATALLIAVDLTECH
jgi:hypothetical protein